METFEYELLTWERKQTAEAFSRRLATLGAEGWEAIGLSPRSMDVPMPGMGGDARVEVVVLLKRAARA